MPRSRWGCKCCGSEWRCPLHNDQTPCTTKMGEDAAYIVAGCKTAEEAASVAVESMRVIARFSRPPNSAKDVDIPVR